jgi:hypothetical protein
MRQLVATWVRAEKEYYGLSQGQAIKRMNGVLGTLTSCSRVSEWKRGIYCPSVVVLSEMLYRMLPWALDQAGITASAAQLFELEKLLWVIEKGRGRNLVKLL